MAYSINWGTPMHTPPSVGPSHFVQGFGFSLGGLQMYGRHRLRAPARWLWEEGDSHTIDSTTPFKVGDTTPGATVNATLRGEVIGTFALSRSPGFFFLLPSEFVVEGLVEIRAAGGNPTLSPSPRATVIWRQRLSRPGTYLVNEKDFRWNCPLRVGDPYELYLELYVGIRLRGLALWGALPPGAVTGEADFQGVPTTAFGIRPLAGLFGLWADISFPGQATPGAGPAAPVTAPSRRATPGGGPPAGARGRDRG